MGDCPEISIARAPGASTMSCAAFTTPEVGTSVPLGILAVLPVAALESDHPVRSTGTPAFWAIDISMYSFFGSAELALET